MTEFQVGDVVTRGRTPQKGNGVIKAIYPQKKGLPQARVEWDNCSFKQTNISVEFIIKVNPTPDEMMVQIPSAEQVKQGRVRGRQID